jgi:hypothetical protein
MVEVTPRAPRASSLLCPSCSYRSEVSENELVPLDMEELRIVAEAANSSNKPWVYDPDFKGYPQSIVREGDVTLVAQCFESPDRPSVFTEFITTFDPPTILRLLDLLESCG